MRGLSVLLLVVLATTQVYPSRRGKRHVKNWYNHADYGINLGKKQEIETNINNERKHKNKGIKNQKQSRRKSKAGRKRKSQKDIFNKKSKKRANKKPKLRSKNKHKKRKEFKNKKRWKGRGKRKQKRRQGRQAGVEFEVTAEDLYEDYTKYDPSKFAEDNECRYRSPSGGCYCCGAFFVYQEHGPVCTRFCPNSEGGQLFCQRRLIVLPSNWGFTTPDKIHLDDGAGGQTLGTEVEFTSKPVDPSGDATEVTAKCPTNAFSLDTLMPAPQTTDTNGQCQSTQVAEPSFECSNGEKCVLQDCCQSFSDLKNTWKSLPKGSIEYSEKLNELKTKVCNKAGKGVCC